MLLVSLIIQKSLKQTRISIIPTRKADSNIFPIALKQDYITFNMLNFPILYDLFPFCMFYCSHKGKMIKNLIILKESTSLDMIHIKFHDLLLNATLICCASESSQSRITHNSLQHTTVHPKSSICT